MTTPLVLPMVLLPNNVDSRTNERSKSAGGDSAANGVEYHNEVWCVPLHDMRTSSWRRLPDLPSAVLRDAVTGSGGVTDPLVTVADIS